MELSIVPLDISQDLQQLKRAQRYSDCEVKGVITMLLFNYHTDILQWQLIRRFAAPRLKKSHYVLLHKTPFMKLTITDV